MECPLQANSSEGPLPYHMFYQVNEMYEQVQEILTSPGYDCSECPTVKKIVHWVNKHIHYRTDISNFGIVDYWQLPVETLTLGSGDCDCLAFLTASMLEAAGIMTRVCMGNSDFGYHMWCECVDDDGEWLLIETTNGKIYPWENRSKMHYYPDIYINPAGCSPPEDTIITEGIEGYDY